SAISNTAAMPNCPMSRPSPKRLACVSNWSKRRLEPSPRKRSQARNDTTMTSRSLQVLAIVCCMPLLGSAALAGPAQAKKEVDVTWAVKIPMRDGVKLNATVYKRKGGKEALPVVFTMTPYISDNYHDRAMYFARNGYVFALVDVRGRGNSGGEFEPFVH